MKRMVLLIAILGVLVNGGQTFAQNYTVTDEGSGIIFSPMMHRFNLTQNDLRNLRSKNKDFVFDLSIGNNLNRPVTFKTLVGNLAQAEDTFQLAELAPETEIYTVKEEERDKPEETLRKIAETIYGNPEQYLLIARLNNLKTEYKLPAELLIPKIRTETYEVRPGDLLLKIAKAVYGDEKMAVFIAEVNGLQKPYEIRQGQRLYIIKMKEEQYTVQERETMEDIAQKICGEKGESIVRLFALANNLIPPFSLTAGQSLTIPEIEKRTVQEGDTLGTVAKSIYGDEYAGILLAYANDIARSYDLTSGQTLFIPKIKPKVYTAQTGDTLETISEKMYGDPTGANLIRILNGIQNPEALNPGETLYIPEVKSFEFSCASWIKPEERKFTLTAHEQKRVFFRTKIPGITISGTYSAIVGVEMDVPEGKEQAGIRSVLAPAAYCPVILNIEGRTPLPKKVEIHSFEIQRKGGLMGLVFGLKNLGRCMVQVQESRVLILREDRSRLYLPMPLGRGLRIVLPGNRIELGTGINPLPPGKYIVQATVYYGGRSPAFLEKAFTIGEGEETKARARTTSFLVSPVPQNNEEEDITIPVIKGKKNVRGVFLNIQNLEINPLSFKVRIVDIPGVKPEYSAKEILTVRPEQFEIGSVRGRNIQIVLKDPQAVAGGRYAQVQIMGYLPEQKEVNSPIEILPGIRMIDVHVVSTESLIREAKVAKLTTEFKEGILKSQIDITNTGNVHIQLKPESRINIMDEIGQIVFSGTLNFPDYIYPSEIKTLELQENLAKVETIGPGKYMLEILLDYGGGKPIQVSTEFVISVIPKNEQEEEEKQ